MQVTELSTEGLKRHYKVVVPADDIEDRVQGRLKNLSRTIRMPGFRPGKAPLGLLRKQYGRSIMGEVLEQAVNEGSQQTIKDHELRPALRPKIEVTAFDEGKDLEFTVSLEVLPPVPQVAYGELQLVRPVASVGDAEIDRAIDGLARAARQYEAPGEPRPAEKDDQLLIDFVGRVEGEPFEGGSGTDARVVLGSGMMIPGFEDQLVGAEAGTAREIRMSLPKPFPKPELAGKEAVFEVTVKEVLAPQPLELDDAFAKRHGMETVDALRKAVQERIEQEYRRVGRARLKRQLLDQLAAAYPFAVPEGMIDLEFETIWKQLEQEMERSQSSFADTGKSEEELRAEYRVIAERRVRLGLLLSDIGNQNGIKVEQHELNAAVIEQARRFPGQEQQVVDFFRNTPQAVEQLRAPIFEDKVVDFILQLAPVSEESVSPEQLFKEPDDEETAPSPPEIGDDAKA
jgi:trigger factor